MPRASEAGRSDENALGPLLRATRTVPIVFVHVPDPVGAGFVDSLARPGGNATGFTLYEYGIGEKCWSCSKRPRRVSGEWRSFAIPN